MLKKKILIVQDFLRMGGTENQSLVFYEVLLNNHISTTLLIFTEGGFLTKKINNVVINSTDIVFFRKSLFIKYIALLNPDLIICMGKSANYCIPSIHKNFSRIKLVSTLRSGKVYKDKVIRSMSCFSYILTNSKNSKLNFFGLGGYGYVSTISNINPHKCIREPHEFFKIKLKKKLKIKSKRVILLCMAAFRGKKGQSDLIKLIKLVDLKNATLLLVGSGV
jgi:hypothetical protein